MKEMIILVDKNDIEVGSIEKMEAHVKGKLHRAFSVFIFNSKGEMMLQRRALNKYHSGGLWTNTCCSHPNAGENLNDAVHRRLQQEMGFDCDVKEIKSFLYHAELDHELIEHELDHIFIGFYDKEPNINKEEVDDWKWTSYEDVVKELKHAPEKFTYWFKIAMLEIITTQELNKYVYKN